MAKFCGKCGSKLDESTGLCPNCDAEQLEKLSTVSADEEKKQDANITPEKPLSKKETKKQKKAAKKMKKKEKRAEWSTGKKIRHFFLKFVLAVLLLGALGAGVTGTLVYFEIVDIPAVESILGKCCGERNKAVAKSARAVADAFTDCDMAAINKTIFGTDEFKVDEELSDIWNETEESRDGVLTHIFEYVTVKVKKTTDSTIEYEIEAPDMSNVFADLKANAEGISEDELLKHIGDYAKNAKTTTTTVSLEYIFVDDAPIVNYQDEKFINAVTGGLLDAYKTLYSEMLEEYTKGEN